MVISIFDSMPPAICSRLKASISTTPNMNSADIIAIIDAKDSTLFRKMLRIAPLKKFLTVLIFTCIPTLLLIPDNNPFVKGNYPLSHGIDYIVGMCSHDNCCPPMVYHVNNSHYIHGGIRIQIPRRLICY